MSIIKTWLDAAMTEPLSVAEDIVQQANQNALYLGDILEFDAPSIAMTIEQMALVYADKATKAGTQGIFYVWVDEMAASLRCSFCHARRVEDLPFGGTLDVIADASSFAEKAKSILVKTYIPWEDLKPAGDWADDDADLDQKCLVLLWHSR